MFGVCPWIMWGIFLYYSWQFQALPELIKSMNEPPKTQTSQNIIKVKFTCETLQIIFHVISANMWGSHDWCVEIFFINWGAEKNCDEIHTWIKCNRNLNRKRVGIYHIPCFFLRIFYGGMAIGWEVMAVGMLLV